MNTNRKDRDERSDSLIISEDSLLERLTEIQEYYKNKERSGETHG